MSIKYFMFAYRVLSRLYFHLPVLFLFFISKNLSLTSIALLLAIYPAAIFATSLVKSKLAIDAKMFLYVSAILNIISYYLIVFYGHYVSFVCAQLILGCSYALAAGEDSKLLFASNTSQLLQQNIQRSSNSMMFLSSLFSGIVGGYFYTIDPSYNFYLAIVANLIILPMLWLLQTKKIKVLKQVTASQQANNITMQDFAYYSLTRGIVLGLFVGFIPFLLSKNSPSPFIFALIICCYMLTGYLSSQFTDKLFINMRHAQIISTALIAVGTVILSISQSEVGIACALVTYGLGTGMVRPITMKKIKNPVDMNKLERYFSLVNIAVLLGLALIYQFYIGEINLPI